ncbi:uncharacterized protein [Argopecten irradians]|uniref:uncharacterized protein n=1 Tax=Argopecten irradians TaxID=31199 RepID=UPI0037191A66
MYFRLALWICLTSLPSLATGADCTTSDFAGDDNPLTRNNADFGASSMSLLTDHSVGCTCGVIHEWLYFARTLNVVYFQVWRDTGGSVYELVGEHQHTPTGTGSNTATFTGTDRIPVEQGDVIGWYSPGTTVVSYKNNGGGPDYRTSSAVGALAVGNTHDWSGDGLQSGKRFGFQAQIEPNIAPTITNLAATTQISDTENTGFLVMILDVYDADGDTITTTMQTVSAEFSFTPGTLQITTKINTIAAGTYPLTFQVQDTCGKTSTGILTIIVNNSPLYITSLASYTIVSQDQTALTLLHTLVTSDASPTDSVASCTLTAAPKFSTAVITGSTYGIYSILNPGFDYTTAKRYDFDTTCTDSYGSSDTSKYYVYVTANNPPVITNLPAKTTISSTIATGTSLFTVTATDTDVTDTITYDAPTCSTATCPFTITAGGEIQTNADISALTNPGYDVFITISDGTNTVGPMVFTVIVSDINSPPIIQNTALTFSLSFMENTAQGTSIYRVTAADPDLDTLTYSATYTPAAEGATVLSFDTSTGLLSTSTASVIDYESLTSTSFTVDVSVTDGTVTDTYSTFTVNVVDINEAPTFGSSIYYVSGNEGNAGESLGNPGFVVTDPDPGDTHTYSVDCSAIAMDANTGAVTLSGTYDLDVSGTASVLTCTATVTDGELTDTTQLIVTILDVNDHTPAFGQSDYTIYTTIYGNVGATIGSIAATDGDLGIYGALTYSLDTSTLSEAYFGVTGTGNIFINRFLTSFGDGAYLSFTANVTDYGGLSDTANVAVIVYATTTAPITTTTERYITFFEYPPNIAWFTLACLTLLLVLAVFSYLIYMHGFLRSLTWEDFRSVCRKTKKRIIKRRPKKKVHISQRNLQGGVTFASPDLAYNINTQL